MKILTRFLVFIGSLLVLALFAALIAPSFIEWDRFRSEFEIQATRLIGQPVKVGGETRVRFLPLPYVSFNQLQVGQNEDGTPLMTLEQFSLNAELFPFLSGEVRIVDMEMRNPHLNLQVDENGTIAWTNPEVQIVRAEDINIEKLDIVGGSINIEGLTGGRTLKLDAINADVSAQSIIGPWQIRADTEIEGVPSSINISTGTYQESGEIRLKAELERKDTPYELLVDGPLRLEENTLFWSGNFEITPFSAARVEASESREGPLPVAIEGQFVGQPRNIEITEYRMDIGDVNDPYTITGLANVSIDDEITFIAQADGRQIDLDHIREVQNADNRSGSLEERINTLRSIIEKVPVPKVKGEVDLILPAIIAGDTYIRDVTAKISPLRNGWDLRFFNATFPGNTLLEAQGRVGLYSDFGFNGKMLLASRQPSGFANWVSGDVSPQFRRLKAAGFSANVTISERQTTFQNLELQLDDARLIGKLQRISSPGKRPAIIAQLAGNRVNIDDLQAIYSLAQDNDEVNSLVTHDLDVTIQADQFEAMVMDQPLLAKGVDAQVNISDGRVSLDRLKAEDFYGASIETNGRIEKLLTNPDGNIKLVLEAENAGELLKFTKRFAGEKLVLNNLLADQKLLENTRLSLELETRTREEGAKGQVIVKGVSGGTDIDFQLLFDGRINDLALLPMEVNASISNSDPSVFLRQVGIETLPSEFAETISVDFGEKVEADIYLKGLPGEGMDAQILLLNGESTLSAKGKLATMDAEAFDASLEITFGSGDLLPILVMTGIQAPGLVQNQALPVSASFQFQNSEIGYQLDGLTGQIAGNPFSGNLIMRKKDIARPRLEGDITFAEISVPIIAETVVGIHGGLPQVDILDSGSANFRSALYNGYDARLNITANHLKFNEKHKGKNARLELVMLDGKLDANALQFEYMDGLFSGTASLQNNLGTVLANASFKLDGIDGGKLLALHDVSRQLNSRMTLSATLESAARSYDALVRNLSGDGILDMNAIKAEGFTALIFDEILAETVDENYEITPENVAALVKNSALSSHTSINNINVPFSISRGQLRIRNMVHELDAAKMTGDFRHDFSTHETDARLGILFEPTIRDRIAGADAQIAFIWKGQGSAIAPEVETSALESYLSLRAFENSQRRIETLEARVLETQRLQRQIAFAFEREQFAIRKEEERRRLEEEARFKAEAEAREERERLRLEAERKAAEQAEQERLAREQAQQEQIPENVLEDIDKLLFGLE